MQLTTNQRAKIRELATDAHEARMRVVGLSRVLDEALRFKTGLARSLEDAKQLVDRLYPGFRQLEIMHQRGRLSENDFEFDTVSYRNAKAAFDALQDQLAEARADIDRLHERINEENEKAAPLGQLVDRILQHARVNRADLGIDFAESDAGLAASVAPVNVAQSARRIGSVA